MATLADIAKIAGVGVMSVSRVVHGTRPVSPETERKVRAAIEKVGYRPNEAARVLRGQRARVIGLIVPNLADPFFATFANAVHETAWEAGYMTLMAGSADRNDIERRETEFMVERRIAGMLVAPLGFDNHHFETAQNNDVPLVSFDRPMDGMDVDVFVVDNRAAAAHATQHLIGHGHRDILCIAHDENAFTRAERVAGYSEAMRHARLPVRTCLVGHTSGPLPPQIDFILHSTPPPTAIIVMNNVIAVELLRELQKRSIAIPGQLALIAFDDFDAATLVRPTITVVRQPVADLGRKATSALLARINGELCSEPGSHFIQPTELIIRESCGCHGARKYAGEQVSSRQESAKSRGGKKRAP